MHIKVFMIFHPLPCVLWIVDFSSCNNHNTLFLKALTWLSLNTISDSVSIHFSNINKSYNIFMYFLMVGIVSWDWVKICLPCGHRRIITRIKITPEYSPAVILEREEIPEINCVLGTSLSDWWEQANATCWENAFNIFNIIQVEGFSSNWDLVPVNMSQQHLKYSVEDNTNIVVK